MESIPIIRKSIEEMEKSSAEEHKRQKKLIEQLKSILTESE